MSCKRVYKNQWDKKVLERDMHLKSSGISEIMSLAFFTTMYPYVFDFNHLAGGFFKWYSKEN